uniref:Uncharacterized protein n=1 Tax=viral metagenome TaxID=1070528 RepID=A0A6H1ZWU8_9ZZZZ
MTKLQFKNLSHAYRQIKRLTGNAEESLAWILHYSIEDFFCFKKYKGRRKK